MFQYNVRLYELPLDNNIFIIIIIYITYYF